MNIAAEQILATSIVKGLRILLISYDCMAVSFAVCQVTNKDVLLLLLLLFLYPRYYYYYYYFYYYVFEVFKTKTSVNSTYATLELELQLDFQHGRRQPSLIRP